MVTDLAPWPSLVQRFGRLNRKGELAQAKAYWVDVPNRNALPYSEDELDRARQNLASLATKHNSIAPVDLPPVEEPPPGGHLLRRKDLIDLFDTTPDLAGHDTDISRYIRDGQDHDVQVYWRVLGDTQTNRGEQTEPYRDELCSVPIGEFKSWIKGGEDGHIAWHWDFLEAHWMRAREKEIYPGQLYLVPTAEGGYASETGWAPSSKVEVLPVLASTATPLGDDSTGADPLSENASWETIAEHTQDVYEQLQALLACLPHLESNAASLLLAARWHDRGKAHPAFQSKIITEARLAAGYTAALLAKAPRVAWGKHNHEGRSHFRHELASALGVLSGKMTDLVAYLVASHHGKVRLSIRSLPEENIPPEINLRYARGVWERDKLPPCNLGGGVQAPETTLELTYMEMGLDVQTGPSWTDRMLELRDTLGIFKLAYLEAILRAADQQASAGMAIRGDK